MTVTHLTRKELRRWRDAPAIGVRERVVAHLAECDVCCREYAELMRTRPPDTEPALDAASFVERGYHVHKRVGHPSVWHAVWFKPAAAIAASVLVALTLWQLRPASEDVVMRGVGAQIDLLAPATDAVVDASVSFEWRAEPGSACRLRAYDPNRPDAPLVDRPAASAARLEEAEVHQFAVGVTYRWFVECRSPRGDTMTSPAGRFRWR